MYDGLLGEEEASMGGIRPGKGQEAMMVYVWEIVDQPNFGGYSKTTNTQFCAWF